MVSESRIVVRYAETDKMGIVYHANYLIWFEIGRTGFLEDLGYPYAAIEEKGIVSPVLHIECDFGTPLRYGDAAIIRTRMTEVSGAKSVFCYDVYREGQTIGEEKPCCTGRSTHCFVLEGSFKPVSMKRYAPDLYQAYQQALEPLF